ncbi:MAG TPA: PHP-associated domain-containing protein [Terriglobia bacterium]|nr:PHP-associated domain-containing protein [Terriglobia bacterium]
MCDVPGLGGFCRESYNDPLALYGHLKRLGMDLVTVTDHDSIDAAEALRGKPDFFLSEEVSCVMPGGTRLHVGVYDLGERHHVELQRRRDDLPRFLSYLREQVLFFSVNHPLSRLTGQRKAEDFEWFEREFPAFEVLNGHMPAASNRRARALAATFNKMGLGGSDAHTILSAGTAFTEVAGARPKQEYLRGLRCAQGRVGGDSGSTWKLTRDVWIIAANMMRENPWAGFLAPLAVAVPLVTFANCVLEANFARHWAERWTALLEDGTLPPAGRAFKKPRSLAA